MLYLDKLFLLIMMNKFYPTCVDNFLEKPQKFIDFSNNLSWYPTPGNFPGIRTSPFYKFNEELNTYLTLKILSVYFDFNLKENIDNISWNQSEIHFQKVNKFSNDIDSSFNKGWIHKDNEELAFVVYLNENIPDVAGTNIYTLKKDVDEETFKKKIEFNMVMKNWLYTGQNVKEHEYRNSIEEIEDYFDESILFRPRFNRLVVYGKDYHSANNYWMPENEQRFFMVGFINGIKCKNSPLERIKNKTIESNIEKNLFVKKSQQEKERDSLYDKIINGKTSLS